MNRVGIFVLGVAVGCVGLQVGHALYLRSAHYVEAAVTTAVVGAVLAFIAHVVAEDWD